MSSYNMKPSDAGVTDEKNKQWQREFLMERLRNHQLQRKGFPELSKAVRMAMLEKRYALDAVEKSNLQKCLDSMQHCIKVTTKKGLIERLESLSRQLGLKFMEDSSGLFISSDMFFLEIILDTNGKLSDVKVHHECKIEQQSCSELVTCLLNGDFADFTNQLEGLSSIYQLNAEPKVKSKAFIALQAMETDLFNVFKWQSFNKDVTKLLVESPVGLVQKRRGGHPMKLTYFIPPYDLLCLENKLMFPLTMDLLHKDIGLNVSVNLEASSANKLQILPIVNFVKESSHPLYSPLSQMNSTLLPATFVLRLNKPLPVCSSLLTSIGYSNKLLEFSPILNLTIQIASKGKIQDSKDGLYISLPDQNHCYFFSDNKTLQGTIITNIPFTEPSQVPKILTALKHQALFYTLLSSCIRPDNKLTNIEATNIIEVTVISLFKISVTLQHANEDSMVSIEFILSDLININVRVYMLSTSSYYELYNQKLSKVANTTLSIPITIRVLLKMWEMEHIQSFLQQRLGPENGNLSFNARNEFSNNNHGAIGRSTDFRDLKSKYDRQYNGSSGNAVCENSASNNETTRQQTHLSLKSVPNLISNNGNISPSSRNLFFNQVNNVRKEMNELRSSIRQEDFCKSPKSEYRINTTTNKINISDLNSLGDSKNSSEVNGSHSNAILEKDEKIKIDSELWLKKTSKQKNTISITPINPNNRGNRCFIPKSYNEKNNEQHSEIEIIPISKDILNSITIMPINFSHIKNQNLKKKSNDQVNISHKSEKKRRKKDNTFSSPKAEQLKLKIIDLSNSTAPCSFNKQKTFHVSKKQRQHSANKKSIQKNPRRNFSFTTSEGDKKIMSVTHIKQCGNTSYGGKPSLSTLKTAAVAATSSHSLQPIKEQTKKFDNRSNYNLSIGKLAFPSPTSNLLYAGSKKSKILHTNNEKSFEKYEINGITNGNNLSLPNNVELKHSQSKIPEQESFCTIITQFNKDCRPANEILSENVREQQYVELYQQSKAKDNFVVNSQYMIKPSFDGMKLTINKTKSMDISNRQGNMTPKSLVSLKNIPRSSLPYKKHNGLKPGVLSGPASKSKTTGITIPSKGLGMNKISNKSKLFLSKTEIKNKSIFKSNSSECLSVVQECSSIFSPSHNALSKSLSSSSINFSSSNIRKDRNIKNKMELSTLAPIQSEKHLNNIRAISQSNIVKLSKYSPKVIKAMDGFMKTLNTNFQIPKLSARSPLVEELHKQKSDSNLNCDMLISFNQMKNTESSSLNIDEKLTEIATKKEQSVEQKQNFLTEKNDISKNDFLNLSVDHTHVLKTNIVISSEQSINIENKESLVVTIEPEDKDLNGQILASGVLNHSKLSSQTASSNCSLKSLVPSQNIMRPHSINSSRNVDSADVLIVEAKSK